MKSVLIIGLAVTGLMTLCVDLYFITDIAEQKALWKNAFMIYLILLIPPFLMFDQGRREATSTAFEVGGLAIIDLSKYIAIGFLFYIGWYLASTVFV